ncbi:MAG TPA: MFS transporter [Acidimicrobiales bacterium]|nr:MFS transporter [Acidimicrobiales bacterium]
MSRRPATPAAHPPPIGLGSVLDSARLTRFHYRAVLTAGIGFFTDSYDLFVIGAVLVILKEQWHLGPAQASLVSAAALGAAFVGSFVFGRIADLFGRKRVYGLEAAIMVVGALGSAFAPSVAWLIAFRIVLGIGIGGDYPVSAVMMSEYANVRDRGRLVGLVFSMQAAGLVVGPLAAIVLVGSGMPHAIVWRVLLGLGAIPAAIVIHLRRKMPESPRYEAAVRGNDADAARQVAAYSGGTITVLPVAGSQLAPQGAASAAGSASPAVVTSAAACAPRPGGRRSFRELFTNRRLLITLIGTAGTWFIFDYAYYGNSISTPVIIKDLAPHASLMVTLALTLAIFSIAAVPGYVMAVAFMDRVGHRRLQLIGFAVMAGCFAAIAAVPALSVAVLPFLMVYGISYFFAEFGPNSTTFVLPAELFPTSLRTTGHGISAGVAKVGAFIGVYLFPILSRDLGLRGTLAVTAGCSFLGCLLTLVLPEPSRRSLDELDRPNGFGPANDNEIQATVGDSDPEQVLASA